MTSTPDCMAYTDKGSGLAKHPDYSFGVDASDLQDWGFREGAGEGECRTSGKEAQGRTPITIAHTGHSVAHHDVLA
jgi:hypothetical protein